MNRNRKRNIISSAIFLTVSTISYAQYANVEQLNNSASCDSTCSIDPDKVKVLSGQNQRLSNCGYGYTGSSLEDRVVNQDGSWGEWREVNRDNCACTPLTENQEISCPTNQRGQHIETRNWTCPSVSQGIYTDWVTKSNTCSYYYLNTSTEEQTIACPLNQRGTHIQTRSYENWSDGNKKNYTAWSTKSNTCDYYLTAASQTETSTGACSSGVGNITYLNRYDLYSDGSKRNTSSSVLTNNCISSSPSFNIEGEYYAILRILNLGSNNNISLDNFAVIHVYREYKHDSGYYIHNIKLYNTGYSNEDPSYYQFSNPSYPYIITSDRCNIMSDYSNNGTSYVFTRAFVSINDFKIPFCHSNNITSTFRIRIKHKNGSWSNWSADVKGNVKDWSN